MFMFSSFYFFTVHGWHGAGVLTAHLALSLLVFWLQVRHGDIANCPLSLSQITSFLPTPAPSLFPIIFCKDGGNPLGSEWNSTSTVASSSPLFPLVLFFSFLSFSREKKKIGGNSFKHTCLMLFFFGGFMMTEVVKFALAYSLG